jgi:hypothetical protein
MKRTSCCGGRYQAGPPHGGISGNNPLWLVDRLPAIGGTARLTGILHPLAWGATVPKPRLPSRLTYSSEGGKAQVDMHPYDYLPNRLPSMDGMSHQLLLPLFAIIFIWILVDRFGR